jgi:hypothetical protein
MFSQFPLGVDKCKVKTKKMKKLIETLDINARRGNDDLKGRT